MVDLKKKWMLNLNQADLKLEPGLSAGFPKKPDLSLPHCCGLVFDFLPETCDGLGSRELEILSDTDPITSRVGPDYDSSASERSSGRSCTQELSLYLNQFLTFKICIFWAFFFGRNPYFIVFSAKSAKFKETQKRKKTLFVNTPVLTVLVKMSVFLHFSFLLFFKFPFFAEMFFER